MESTTKPGTDAAVQSATEAWTQPRSLPCSQPCTDTATKSGTKSRTQDKRRRLSCPRGYSGLQIAILSVLRSPHVVLSYWQIARLVQSSFGQDATEGAVRGAIERLAPYKLLVRERAARGRLKGNRYAFNYDPCQFIMPLSSTMESVTQSTMQSTGYAAPAASSILVEIDRNTLSVSSDEEKMQTAASLLESLSDDDIAFHWPKLTEHGFGTDQIRQILARLGQVNAGPERVMQGLTHAEWELEKGRMRDKSGNQVLSPVRWVFKILAHQGYYPRPEGYRSPEEQAELDAATELERCATAAIARQAAEAEAWIAKLTPEERKAILGPQNGAVRIPETVSLRSHFRTEVWPTLHKMESS